MVADGSEGVRQTLVSLAGAGRRAQWSDRRVRERQRTEAEGAQRSPEVAARRWVGISSVGAGELWELCCDGRGGARRCAARSSGGAGCQQTAGVGVYP